MPTLVELTAQIVSSHASGSSLSSDDLIKEIQSVFSTLKDLEAGVTISVAEPEPAEPQKIDFRQIFKKDEVICMLCNKGFKTLKRHLSVAHDLKPAAYREQFGISSKQSLAAKSYVESRRKMAIDKGLGSGLVKARAARKANADANKASVAKTKIAPTAKAKAVKAKDKVAVPKKTKAAKAPSKTVKPAKTVK